MLTLFSFEVGLGCYRVGFRSNNPTHNICEWVFGLVDLCLLGLDPNREGEKTREKKREAGGDGLGFT